ncbi:hypothetical protein PENTCL1PPCAC_19159, partial [Pristionchus entomophagus]
VAAHVIRARDSATLAAGVGLDGLLDWMLTSSADLANQLALRLGEGLDLEQLLQVGKLTPPTTGGNGRVETARVRVK